VSARVVALAALVVVLFAGASCTHVEARPSAPLPATSEVESQLALARARHQRLSGLFKARSTGLEGFVASTDLDVIAEQPARLHLAVRSFFGQPSQVLTVDDDSLWLYDATGEGEPRFFHGAASASALERVLGVPLVPKEAIALLFTACPEGSVEAVDSDPDPAKYRAILRLRDGGQVSLTLAREDHRLLGFDRLSPVGARLYSVRIEPGAKNPLAARYVIDLGADGSGRSLVLEPRELEVDGPAVDPLVFSLEPPPGTVVEPL